jgi:enoyl-CoA hydratase/carnithine racemase
LHSTNSPSVTLLSGPSYGGGVELALATDFRWSIGKSCNFNFTQLKFGIPAGWGGMLRLSELSPQLSPKKVSAIIVGKMKFELSQLLYLGLVDREFSTKKLCHAAIDEWVNQIAECPKSIKNELMNRQSIYNFNELEEYDLEIFDKYFLKDDHKKKITEFLNGKKKK